MHFRDEPLIIVLIDMEILKHLQYFSYIEQQFILYQIIEHVYNIDCTDLSLEEYRKKIRSIAKSSLEYYKDPNNDGIYC